MVNLYNFNINSKDGLSKQCNQKQIFEFSKLCEYVKRLPYGRNSNRSHYNLILEENMGTCSTKHAFLAQVAIENNIQAIELFLGIYRMKDSNTDGVKSVLKAYDLDYIPEAHTYLKYNEDIYDFTRSVSSTNSFENDILFETQIRPNQIGDFKINLHQSFLKQWIKDEDISYAFEELWEIREQCIDALKQ